MRYENKMGRDPKRNGDMRFGVIPVILTVTLKTGYLAWVNHGMSGFREKIKCEIEYQFYDSIR